MQKVYSIKDAKIGFMPVHVTQNKLAEMRNFAEAVNQKDSYLNKFAKDFSLWEVADFDETTGIIKGYDQPKFVEEAVNVLAQE